MADGRSNSAIAFQSMSRTVGPPDAMVQTYVPQLELPGRPDCTSSSSCARRVAMSGACASGQGELPESAFPSPSGSAPSGSSPSGSAASGVVEDIVPASSAAASSPPPRAPVFAAGEPQAYPQATSRHPDATATADGGEEATKARAAALARPKRDVTTKFRWVACRAS